eukprot:SAG22_NODE_3431_length_1715_cov_1.814975_2_plen_74_part_00
MPFLAVCLTQAPAEASAAEAAWTPTHAPMRSAYAVASGGAEPEWTNFAKRGFSGGEAFCECVLHAAVGHAHRY